MKSKKIFSAIFGVIMILAIGGCSNEKKNNVNIENPYSIAYQEAYLSYYDTQDTMNDTFSDIIKTYEIPTLPFNQDKESDINIVFDDNGCIRSIQINSPEIVTYSNISVGDNVTRITDTFNYEVQVGETYSVMFDGINEIDSQAGTNDDSKIWITYNTENDVVTQISIYDVKYGREMR